MNQDALRKTLKLHGFKKLRRVFDEVTCTVTDTLRIPTNLGGTVQIDLPPILQSSGKLLARLREVDALLPAEGERKTLLEAILEYIPQKRHRYAARTGWADDRAAFVLPHTVVGSGNGELIGLSPKKLEGDHPLKASGDLEAWQAGVARPAELSSTLTFCVSAAFAAPLLSVTGEMSFGLCVYGDSRIGKSRGMLAAGSVIGIGKQDRLPSWDLTNPGLQLLLARFNSLVCPLDDLMTLGATGTERARWLEKLAYHLSSGQARLHSRAYDAEHGRDPTPWSTLVLTSSEKSLADGRSGKSRQGGAAVRFIDVPALLGGDDIFDRLETEGKRTQAVEKLLRRMTKACAAHHGRAFEHYLNHLIANRTELEGHIEAAATHFREHVEHPPTDTAMTRDLARKFGLIYSGASLAIQAGTVPWSEANALASVASAYHAARKGLPDEALELRDGLKLLTRDLRSLPTAREWRRSGPKRFKLTRGYRWRSLTAHVTMIQTQDFAAIFDSVPQRRAVERYLIEHELIEMARPRSSTSQAKPMQQHVWIDDERHRSYRIKVPFGGFFHRNGRGSGH